VAGAPSLPSAAPAAPAVTGTAAAPGANHPSHLASHGIGCAVAGTAGTGLAMAVGPPEILAMIGSALLMPVSPILIGAALGTVFVTGCAVGAAVSPLVTG
jgi:hypothetical protein